MRFSSDQFDTLSARAISGEDATIYAFNDPDVAGRYVVGGVCTSTLPHDASPERTRSCISRVYADASGEVETMGVWMDNGLMYIDAGTTYDSHYVAMTVARDRGELAIYDRKTNDVLRVNP